MVPNDKEMAKLEERFWTMYRLSPDGESAILPPSRFQPRIHNNTTSTAIKYSASKYSVIKYLAIKYSVIKYSAIKKISAVDPNIKYSAIKYSQIKAELEELKTKEVAYKETLKKGDSILDKVKGHCHNIDKSF